MGDDSTLWVGGLADQVSEDHLFELFLQAGPLEKVFRPKEKDGTPKKFAFVEFRHAESVPYAIQVMDGIKLFNNHLRLKGRTGSQHDNSHAGSPSAHAYSQHADSPSRSSRGGSDYHRSRSFHTMDDRKKGHHSASGHGHQRGVNRSSSGGTESGGSGGRPFNGPAAEPLSQPFSNSAGFAPSNMQPQSFEDRRNRVLQKQSMSSSFQAQQQQQQMAQNQYGGYNYNYAQSFQQQWYPNQNW
ncbi:RNA-binding protein 7-like isoform X2 [Littorina saxatilis]|uniref:RRM domain-containing protein n=1 Tax=Littorina saxatilis TaxID=31220 RepID=A0AAN9BIL5_9CAEN